MTGRLVVIGDGLIGRSVQLAWLRQAPGAEVRALEAGDDPAALAAADIVVVATPVDAILAWLPRLAALAPRARLITDVGSTKAAVALAAREAGLSRFVPGHPMAGGSTSGPGAARADLFDGRSWFLCAKDCPPPLVGEAEALVRALGATPVVLPADDGRAHDALVAAISHLPQVVATALRARVGAQVGADGLRHAGAGLRDTTRLADSSAAMWRPILATNASPVAALLRALARDLDGIADQLADAGAVDALFARAQQFPFDP